jgi:aconitase A
MSHQQQTSPQQVDIDFLFLDLTSCTRCIGTNEHLETAIDAVKQVLTLTNTQLNINKVLIDSEEKAKEYQFVSSPTIRVNGYDIALETRESRCEACTDLCGCQEGTNCRIWVYQGEEYTQAPVAMIVDAILQEVYGGLPRKPEKVSEHYDEVPQNLQNFFASQNMQPVNTSSDCCVPEEQKKCCEPAEKLTCCGEATETDHCGCQ